MKKMKFIFYFIKKKKFKLKQFFKMYIIINALNDFDLLISSIIILNN